MSDSVFCISLHFVSCLSLPSVVFQRLKELQCLEKDLLDKIYYQDLDVVQIYRDEKPGVRSPTDREKRREERIRVEDIYLQVIEVTRGPATVTVDLFKMLLKCCAH